MAALFAVQPLTAQQDVSDPVDPSVFEGIDQEPKPSQSDVRSGYSSFMGSSRSASGFTSRFDPSFNPAIGLIFDGFAVFADAGTEERGANYDNINLRAVELAMSSRIDPLGWAYFSAEFGNEGGGEYEFELLEGAVWFDQLPGNWTIRAGRYFSDFGKWNSIHIHDRPYPFEEGVRQEFFGGSLITDGIELHHWFGAGDVPVRWSVGLASGFEGHSHSVLAFEGGEEDEEEGHSHGFASESHGDRGLENFAFTGRLTAQHDIGSNGFFQWGLSAFLTDEGLLAEEEIMGMEEEFPLGQSTLAIDLLYRNVDASQQRSRSVGAEIFFNDRDVFDDDLGAVRDADGVGFTTFVEEGLNSDWSIGAQASWWEHSDKEDGGDWLTGNDAGRQASIYASWQLSEFQRIRFALANFDPTPGEDADWVIAVQWLAILGSHSHPLDW